MFTHGLVHAAKMVTPPSSMPPYPCISANLGTPLLFQFSLELDFPTLPAHVGQEPREHTTGLRSQTKYLSWFGSRCQTHQAVQIFGKEAISKTIVCYGLSGPQVELGREISRRPANGICCFLFPAKPVGRRQGKSTTARPPNSPR